MEDAVVAVVRRDVAEVLLILDPPIRLVQRPDEVDSLQLRNEIRHGDGAPPAGVL